MNRDTTPGISARSKRVSCDDSKWTDPLWFGGGGRNGKSMDVILANATAHPALGPCVNIGFLNPTRPANVGYAGGNVQTNFWNADGNDMPPVKRFWIWMTS